MPMPKIERRMFHEALGQGIIRTPFASDYQIPKDKKKGQGKRKHDLYDEVDCFEDDRPYYLKLWEFSPRANDETIQKLFYLEKRLRTIETYRDVKIFKAILCYQMSKKTLKTADETKILVHFLPLKQEGVNNNIIYSPSTISRSADQTGKQTAPANAWSNQTKATKQQHDF